MAVSKRTRFEVFKRDKFTCQYCGRRPPDVMLEADHIVPRSKGGKNEIDNLTTACGACNRGKSDVPLDDVAPALDELELLAGIQEMLERKRNLEHQAVVANATRDAIEKAIDVVQDWWDEAFTETAAIDVFERPSIKRFLENLTLDDLRLAVDKTELLSKRKPWMVWEGASHLWRYFCGVCWNLIREEQDTERDAWE